MRLEVDYSTIVGRKALASIAECGMTRKTLRVPRFQSLAVDSFLFDSEHRAYDPKFASKVISASHPPHRTG